MKITCTIDMKLPKSKARLAENMPIATHDQAKATASATALSVINVLPNAPQINNASMMENIIISAAQMAVAHQTLL